MDHLKSPLRLAILEAAWERRSTGGIVWSDVVAIIDAHSSSPTAANAQHARLTLYQLSTKNPHALGRGGDPNPWLSSALGEYRPAANGADAPAYYLTTAGLAALDRMRLDAARDKLRRVRDAKAANRLVMSGVCA